MQSSDIWRKNIANGYKSPGISEVIPTGLEGLVAPLVQPSNEFIHPSDDDLNLATQHNDDEDDDDNDES